MKADNKYTKMQQEHYRTFAKPWSKENLNPIYGKRDEVVGNFKQLNEWPGYEKYMFKNIDTTSKTCLDFACGAGRNLVKYNKLFKRIDGVDINNTNLENAKLWLKHNGINPDTSTLYLCNGVNLDCIKDNAYDVVISTLSFQHICVYDIRFGYLSEFFRVLKPGGWISIQMGFGPKCKHNESGDKRSYYSNDLNISGTNGMVDVEVESVDQIQNDLEKIGFTNFIYDLDAPGPNKEWCSKYGLHEQWIYFRAQK